MKNLLKFPFVLPAVVLLAGTLALAQDAAPYADASAAFSQLQSTATGTVSQLILHAPAGDVLAVYIGRTSRSLYTKQDELLIVISGHGTANVGYPSYDLKPGSVVSIARNTAFQITSTGRTPIKGYLIASPQDDPNDRRILEP